MQPVEDPFKVHQEWPPRRAVHWSFLIGGNGAERPDLALIIEFVLPAPVSRLG